MESKIRDKLINNLTIIEKGLTYIEKEKFIPNELGTNGFVDIFAKDVNNRYVIIELKRSKSSSREALHEVLKYLEGIKTHKSLTDDEIRIIIVSTEWEELLIPYSSFVKRTNCFISGFKLEIDDECNPLQATLITPLLLENDRLLSDSCMIRYYLNKESLKNGIKAHENYFEKLKINDYILVVIKITDEYYNTLKTQVLDNLKQMTSNSDSEIIKKANKLPKHEFMIYSAHQMINENKCYDILKLEQYMYDFSIDEISTMDDKEEINRFLNGQILNIGPFPFSDFTEIGYSAKFYNFIFVNDLEILEIKKYGLFKNNELLQDDLLINELCGSSGINQKTFKKSFSSDFINYTNLSKDVKRCLKYNLPWQRQLLHVLEEIESIGKNHNFECDLSIFNPMNSIYSIFLTLHSDDLTCYIPNYMLLLKLDDSLIFYYGKIDVEYNNIRLNEIIKNHFENDESDFAYQIFSIGYDENDVDISRSFGFKYNTYKNICDKDGHHFYKYNEYTFIECEETNPFDDYIKFAFSENDLVKDIIKFCNDHYLGGGMFSF